MYKKLFLILLCFWGTVSHAESKFIDGRGYCSSPNIDPFEGEYYVTFYATAASIAQPSFGHAFIGLSAPKDNINNVCKPETAYGQYPTKDAPLWAQFKAGDSYGFRKEDLKSISPAEKLKVRITYDTYLEIQKVISKWYNQRYVIGISDCISFVEEVAKSTPWLKAPPRKMYYLPYDYLSILISLNTDNYG
ncbi:hypothetical protein [Vibrio diazotrophicus]|uniref:hypothetical protein n=1 Tax=Vibrio diazotrophicus TaxID=685 RepID=UPI000C9DD260|nr:hypothetical protein [Vibrio diazotrophicus]PNH91325.1 hypothetical protein C1M59_14570 [Vibrio diazotrophicus]